MPKSSAPRKKYRPKKILLDPVGETIKGLNPAKGEQVIKIQILVHDALAKLTKGEGTRNDWQCVADAINMTIVLMDKGYGLPEWMPDILKARDAMKAMRDRHREGKSLLFRAEELKAVNDAIDLHDQQISVALVKDVEWALDDIWRRVKSNPRHVELI